MCHPLSSLCMSLCMSFFISGGCDSFMLFYHFLYLGNISEPNQNFSIVFFLLFCPSPNITWPLPLPCAPIVHFHIPCFHLMFCVTTFSINAEYINNICIVFYLKSHIFFSLGNSGSCWIPTYTSCVNFEYVMCSHFMCNCLLGV